MARLLLVVHTVLAAALVAVSTHLVVWMRGFPRGRFQRLQAIRKLSLISACLFVATFVVGNVLYPVYKVRVRAEYLEQPSALMDEVESRARARAQTAARYRDSADGDGPLPDARVPSDRELARNSAHVPREAAKVARWFDVKEHWVAFGMALAIAVAVLVRRWHPKRDGGGIANIVFLMALAAAFSTWLGALVGIVVSSYRAVG